MLGRERLHLFPHTSLEPIARPRAIQVGEAMHREALKLRSKGATFHRRPLPPGDDVT